MLLFGCTRHTSPLIKVLRIRVESDLSVLPHIVRGFGDWFLAHVFQRRLEPPVARSVVTRCLLSGPRPEATRTY